MDDSSFVEVGKGLANLNGPFFQKIIIISNVEVLKCSSIEVFHLDVKVIFVIGIGIVFNDMGMFAQTEYGTFVEHQRIACAIVNFNLYSVAVTFLIAVTIL